MLPSEKDKKLAEYILGWLRSRNAGQMAEALDGITVGDARIMREELEMILMSGGKPPNWIESTKGNL